MVVRLTTRLPAEASEAHAWGVWGEPRVEWHRPPAEMWRSMLGLAARIRHSGVLGTLRQIRDLPASDEHATRYRRWIALNTPTPEALAQMATDVKALSYRPRISVLTPVYNTDARWLRACIVGGAGGPDKLCLADDGPLSNVARVAERTRIRCPPCGQ